MGVGEAHAVIEDGHGLLKDGWDVSRVIFRHNLILHALYLQGIKFPNKRVGRGWRIDREESNQGLGVQRSLEQGAIGLLFSSVGTHDEREINSTGCWMERKVQSQGYRCWGYRRWFRLESILGIYTETVPVAPEYGVIFPVL